MAEFTQTTYPVDPEAGKDPLKAETVEQIEAIISSSPTVAEINKNLDKEMNRLHQDDVVYYSCNVYVRGIPTSTTLTVIFEDQKPSYDSTIYYKRDGEAGQFNLTTLEYSLTHNSSLVINTKNQILEIVDTNQIDRNKHLTLLTNHRGILKHNHLFAMWYPNIQIGTSAPTSAPHFIGEEFIDTTNKKIYRAVGFSSSSDWIALN